MSSRRIPAIVPASAAVLESDENPLRGMTPEQRARETALQLALYDALTALFLIEHERAHVHLSSATVFAAKRALERGEATKKATAIPLPIALALLHQSQQSQQALARPSRRGATSSERKPRQPRPTEAPVYSERRKVWRFDPTQFLNGEGAVTGLCANASQL